jgi:hypothetical protein
MPEKDQKMRFTRAELSLMKNTFADNEALLFALRKFLLGFSLTKQEEKELEVLRTGEAYKLVKKVYTPEIDPNAPLFQLVDMKLGLNVDLKGQTEEFSLPHIQAKMFEIDYMETKISELSGAVASGEVETLESLGDLSHPLAFPRIIARNYLLSYIDSYTNEIKFLAGTKEETVEETLEKLKKNSTK